MKKRLDAEFREKFYRDLDAAIYEQEFEERANEDYTIPEFDHGPYELRSDVLCDLERFEKKKERKEMGMETHWR